MTPKVLDASALLAYLEKEPGYEKVQDALTQATEHEKKLEISAVNWGEVCYILARDYGWPEAEKIIKVIETFPMDLVPADGKLAQQAAWYKSHRKLPYADGFAAALADFRKAELLTADRVFKSVESDVKINWVH